MPHTHRRTAAPFLVSAALACCLAANSARTQTDAPLRLTNTPAHATSLNPTLSGDGRRVAFESSADLTDPPGRQQFRAYLADVSGAAAPSFTRLADSRAPAPALSHDGSRVAFSSAEDLTGANPDRNPEIFLRDGAALLRQLTDTTPAGPSARTRDGSFRPSITDDGRLVAFSSNRDLTGANPDGNSEIFLYDTAARSFSQLTNTAGRVGATDPKLGGDGARLAYVKDDSAPRADNSDPRPDDDAARDLVVLDLRTNASRVVAAAAPGLALTPGRAVSRDGLRVVYSAADASGATQVYLFDGRNDAVRQLTTLGRRAADVPLHPTVSGDGSRVAFATRRSLTPGEPAGGVDLYLLDLPTRKLSRVTDGPSRATAEVVSSLDDPGSLVAFNFPRSLAEDTPAPDDDSADASEIFLARLEPRPPFSGDLEILHAAALARAPERLLAPGQIALARGANLSLASERALPGADRAFPRLCKGVSVAVNGRPAQIFFVSPAQINFQIPDETEVGLAQVVVRNHDGYESRAEVQIAPTAPGVFTEAGDGRGPAVALDALNQLRGPFDPVNAANEPRRLSIFTTGLGRARSVSVTAAGVQLAVEAVVPSPDLPGLDEVHVVLQRRLAGAGAVPLVVNADGRAGNPTTLHFVGARKAARVSLTPTLAALGVGRSARFAAAVFDADGFEIPGAQVAFQSSDANVVTVDAAGTARGVRAGVATVRADAGDVFAEAEVRVHALSLVLNEVLADPPDGAAGDANRDGARDASDDEFVEIVNASDVDADLGGYSLSTRAAGGAQTTRHVFPTGTILQPGASAVVFGGATAPAFNPRDAAFGGALVSTASTGGLSLPNAGATVTLHDPAGLAVERLDYGGAAGPPADRNQSFTRAPDVTGDFSLHLNTGAGEPRAFSPGTRLDGTPFPPTAPAARVEIAPASAALRVGASEQFTARAFGADGRELSGVIFRWQTTDPSVAGVDGRGLALGVRPGSAGVFAHARGVESARATLTVTPPPRRVFRVEISPAAAAVNRGGAQDFAARAFDQHGRPVPDAVFTWRSVDAAVASVDAEGRALGVGFGPTRLVAATDDGAGGTVEAEAAVEVRVPLVLNELLADVPADDAATEAVEGDANRDGLRRADADEFVELVNASDAPVNLSGLRIFDAATPRFTFPAGTTLAPGRAVVVFGGGPPPTDGAAFGGALLLAAASLGLNDGGDTVSVRLAVGGEEITVLSQSYGSQGGPPAPADQSLARSPDAGADAPGGGLAPHASAADSAGRPFSPGTRRDGTPFGSPPLTRVEVSPADATLDIGATQNFTARAYANAGGVEIEVPAVSFAWESGSPARAALAPPAGASTRARARAAGRVLVRARAGGLQGEAALEVNPPPPVLTRITVTPEAASVVSGGAQQFVAQAFDQSDAVMTGVTFEWTSSDPAVAAVDARGLATAARPGTTQVRASAGGVTSRPAALSVTRRVVRVELSPASAKINRGGTQRFDARAFDQDGQPVPDAPLTWSSGDALVASVNHEGLARGAGAGAARVNVSTPDGAGGTLSASASLDVRLPLVLNELLADVRPDDAATDAAEGDANRDGARSATADEFVELLNASHAPVDLSGLRLSDATAARFTFPEGTTLAAGRSAVVFGGGSPPASDPAFGGALVFAASALSLNDGGDTVSLKLTLGPREFVVFAQPYGTAGGPPAPADQSLTRAPDASAANDAAGDFAPHLAAPDAAGRDFSPGTRADGTPFGSPRVTRIEIAPGAAALDIGGAQTFTARAFAASGGAEVEVSDASFVWDANDAEGVSLAPATGRETKAHARAAGRFTIRARAGGAQGAATLTINPPPPALTRVELTPQSASLAAGQARQFTARAFDQYGAPFPVGALAFASSAPATAAVEAQNFAPGDSQATASVVARGAGVAEITATASEGSRVVTSAAASVTVEPPPPTPAPGQVVINEALVAFAAPGATQPPRADFVELYNPTDRALDISGLVVSFRAGGAGNNVRAVTLPGAVGSDTVRIGPRSYFLVVNGTQTFGALISHADGRPDGFDASREAAEINPATGASVPSPCAAASNCFDLNNTTGAIKIELGGVKLDGLGYQGAATPPAAPFNAYGEGPPLVFAGGATNDLVRNPNAADTNNNAADFRRNGTAASVTPKAANP